jgi:hypothetical protein
MNWQRVVKRHWDKLIDRQAGLWAGKRDRPKPVARRQAGIKKPTHANPGDHS